MFEDALSFPHNLVNASFLENPETIVIFVGENTTLSCSAVGFPAPAIVWTRDGGIVNALESSKIEIKSLPHGPHTTQSSLTITSATVNLTGMYRCCSITTIEGFPPEVVEGTPATITVQGMQSMSHRVLHDL